MCQMCTDADRLWPKAVTRTAVAWQPYYDQYGLYHAHDPNTTTTTYECSNGHVFSVDKIAMCPVQTCSYGRETVEV